MSAPLPRDKNAENRSSATLFIERKRGEGRDTRNRIGCFSNLNATSKISAIIRRGILILFRGIGTGKDSKARTDIRLVSRSGETMSRCYLAGIYI